MVPECSTHRECIDLDLDWLKDELKDLTKEERRLILSEYESHLQEYGIGISEYKSFVEAFDGVED